MLPILESVLRGCMERFQRWPPPPNWSRTDWLEEVQQVGWAAGWKAATEYDPAKGARFDGFVYQRILAAGLTRYRQEWGYGTRLLQLGAQDLEGFEEEELVASGGCPLNHPAVIQQSDLLREEVREALALLPESQCSLLELLFYKGHTESEVGARWGLGQRAINKRKQAVFKKLRNLLRERGFTSE